LGFGLTAGGLGGRLSEDFAAGDRLSGGFGQGFGGLYGNLTAGPLRAVLQGQLGVTRLAFSDPQSAVEGAGLTTNRFDLGGHASYELALGSVSLTPEIGFTASDVSSHSKDFADVGTMSLTSGATLDAYAGATVASRVTLQDRLVFTPFVRLLVSGQLRSPATALFTDQAGGTATVPLDETGSYATLGLGGDLFRAAGPAGDTMAMGLRADFKRGDHFTEDNYGAYAQVKF
jgi:outer membrane autotransporter protein